MQQQTSYSYQQVKELLIAVCSSSRNFHQSSRKKEKTAELLSLVHQDKSSRRKFSLELRFKSLASKNRWSIFLASPWPTTSSRRPTPEASRLPTRRSSSPTLASLSILDSSRTILRALELTPTSPGTLLSSRVTTIRDKPRSCHLLSLSGWVLRYSQGYFVTCQF